LPIDDCRFSIGQILRPPDIPAVLSCAEEYGPSIADAFGQVSIERAVHSEIGNQQPAIENRSRLAGSVPPIPDHLKALTKTNTIPSSPTVDILAVANLFLLLFLGLADNQTLAALLPVLVRAFHVSIEVAGLLIVAYSAAAALAGFVTGALSDHYGRRLFLLGGAAVFALASWMASTTHTYSELMIARAVTGAAAGTISTCSMAYAGDYFDYAVRGKAIGFISVAYFAAPIVGVPAGAQIASHFGWRTTFVFFAALACLVVCSSLTLKKDRIGARQAPHKLRRSAAAFRSFLGRRDLLAGVGIAFLVSGGLVGFMTYIGEWLNTRFGLTTQGIGWVFMLAGAVAVIGAPLGGMLSDRLGKRSIAIGGCIIMAVAVAAMPFFPWGFLLLVIFGLTSLGAALRQGPLTALMTELIPDTQRGSFMAARGVSSQAGIGTAAFLGGMLYQRYGYFAVTALCALMTAAVVLLLAGYIAEPLPADARHSEG
jgi:DHA1 family inner membrane transport protein